MMEKYDTKRNPVVDTFCLAHFAIWQRKGLQNKRFERVVPLSIWEWANDVAKFLVDKLLSPHKQRPLSGKGMTQLQEVNV